VIRFPKECTRCGRPGHLPKDCTLGLSQFERDMLRQVRGERNAVLLAALCFVLALMLFNLLERVPS
jgi:hypothetical protein